MRSYFSAMSALTCVCALGLASACASSKCPDSATESGGVCTPKGQQASAASAEPDAGGDAALDPGDGGAASFIDASPVDDASMNPTDGEMHAAHDAGHESDATTVMPEDPCESADCDANATCALKKGKAHCECNAGYEGDGTACTRNLCLALSGEAPPCGANTACAEKAGSVECSCEVGFADCDGDPADGCEADLAAAASCGSCGLSCAGALACNDGKCAQAVQKLALGADTSCAIMAPNAQGAIKARCWGRNQGPGSADYRLLGAPKFAGADSTALLEVAEPVRDIATDGVHTCAIAQDADQVLCWGDDSLSELGNVRGAPAPGTRVVTDLPGVTSLALPIQSTCAVAAGDVYCWGNNQSHLMGPAVTATQVAVPTRIDGFAGNVSKIAGAYFGACAISAGNVLECWGNGVASPTAISRSGGGGTLMDVKDVQMSTDPFASSQSFLACALRNNGEVACWGYRYSDALSLIASKPLEAKTVIAAGTTPKVVQIAVGGGHLCALLEDGDVECMGKSYGGVLGFATNDDDVGTAMRVPSIHHVVEIAASGMHTCARLASGQVTCWGRNTNGEVGDGTRVLRSTPVNVVGLP